jgi:ribosomal protein L4
VIDSLEMGEAKTRAFSDFLKAIKIDRTALVALSPDPAKSENTRRSARNIDDVSLCRADQLNCFEMLNHRYLVIGKNDLEAWLSGPSAHTGKGRGNQHGNNGEGA